MAARPEPPTTLGLRPPPAPHPDPSIRLYRKGNWSLNETRILIAAKKLEEERRLKSPGASTSIPGAGGELRWKWVENYCYAKGCERSQNQCNDKWDNLLRDYKKVREYESKRQHRPSYWSLERREKKALNLPSNVASEMFDALNDVVCRRAPPRNEVSLPEERPGNESPAIGSENSQSLEEMNHCESHDSSERQKHKLRRIGSSIMRGASILARTLRTCEEKREKRHREEMEIAERQLQIEEQRNEVNRQGLAAIATAVNGLSDAIQSLVSSQHTHGS